jgi:hypothetical protein
MDGGLVGSRNMTDFERNQRVKAEVMPHDNKATEPKCPDGWFIRGNSGPNSIEFTCTRASTTSVGTFYVGSE